VAKSLSGPNISADAFAKLVDSLNRLRKESYIKSLEASCRRRSNGLGDIRAPTHVIVGSADRLTTPEMARELASSIPGARLTVIDAGHLSNIEQPAAFNAAVIAFLRGL
jgi:3-oxoadipate enol-lactonase